MAQTTTTVSRQSNVLEQAGFPLEAYAFVRDGLAFTQRSVHGEPGRGEHESRHVNGAQLCIGLRAYAIEQFGRLAPAVLSRWGIRTTDDFGRMVFAMVDAGLLRKRAEDRLEDFRGVYDFGEAFGNVRLA